MNLDHNVTQSQRRLNALYQIEVHYSVFDWLNQSCENSGIRNQKARPKPRFLIKPVSLRLTI